jgi:hypothetical protein
MTTNMPAVAYTPQGVAAMSGALLAVVQKAVTGEILANTIHAAMVSGTAQTGRFFEIDAAGTVFICPISQQAPQQTTSGRSHLARFVAARGPRMGGLGTKAKQSSGNTDCTD